MTGRSKGIAFVTFETAEEAQAAIAALNGFEVEGRAIVVNVARPRVPRTNNGGGYNNSKWVTTVAPPTGSDAVPGEMGTAIRAKSGLAFAAS